MRLGIYGGSFDPVHWGHLLLAECCREQCQLDEVWFMPAATPPHKRHAALTSASHRIAMLRRAIRRTPGLHVSTLEVERGGVSYTVETLTRIAAEHPQARLFFLLGADALRDLPTWREPAQIARLATLVAVRREGSPEPDWAALAPVLGDQAVHNLRDHLVEMPRVDLSSRDLRARAAAGRSIRFRTPDPVVDYLLEHRLYRDIDRFDPVAPATNSP